MALNAYMSVTGAKQGLISQGACSEASLGKKVNEHFIDMIQVVSFEQTSASPRDSTSSTVTGEPVHGPIRITKTFDKASALLKVALATGETLTEVIVRFYRSAGQIEHYYEIVLKDARVVEIRDSMPFSPAPGMTDPGPQEEVHISYSSIQWNHNAAQTFGDASVHPAPAA